MLRTETGQLSRFHVAVFGKYHVMKLEARGQNPNRHRGPGGERDETIPRSFSISSRSLSCRSR